MKVAPRTRIGLRSAIRLRASSDIDVPRACLPCAIRVIVPASETEG
jgi:hypothetical protein